MGYAPAKQAIPVIQQLGHVLADVGIWRTHPDAVDLAFIY
jgi:hypothetical protein